MRTEFATWVTDFYRQNKNLVFLTGDLGYRALEGVRDALGERFINVGVAEQNMISVAASLAREGLLPICYSIAPFAVFRPAEQIRVDVCLHGLNVKIVGNGGGFGYGIMGATHHALEDIAFLSSLQQMRCYLPLYGGDVRTTANAMMEYRGPSYLRLNNASCPSEWTPLPFQPIRQWQKAQNNKPLLTIVGLGPSATACQEALKNTDLSERVDLFSVSVLPLGTIPDELVASARASRNVLVAEEHVQRGGLAENLAVCLLQALDGEGFRLRTACARGYPDGLYGSQAYHQKVAGLDPNSLSVALRELTESA